MDNVIIDKDVQSFASMSDAKTLKALREYYKLPTLIDKTVQCKRLGCGKNMTAQFKGSTRVEFFCPKCRYQLSREDQPFAP